MLPQKKSITFPCIASLVNAWCEHGRMEYLRLNLDIPSDKELVDIFSREEFKDYVHVELEELRYASIWPLVEWMRSLDRQKRFKARYEEEFITRRARLAAREKATIILRAILSCSAKQAEEALDKMLLNPNANLKMLGLTDEEIQVIRTQEKGVLEV